MRIRTISFAFGIIAVLLILGGYNHTLQAAEKAVVITHLTCPTGCGSNAPNTIMGNFIAKEEVGIIFRPQETPGYLYNIREMAMNKNRWQNTVFETEETILTLANVAGGTPELKDFLPEKIDVKWKTLWSLCVASQGLWFVTLNPQLKSIADLKGKTVGLGLKTQSDWGMDATLFLNEAYGINTKNTRLFYLGPAKMTDALLDNTVDAISMGMLAQSVPGVKKWLPSSVYLKLQASGRKIHYIPMDQTAIDKVNGKYKTTYILEKVPPGSLQDQEGELTIGSDRVFAAVHPTFPEELAYKLVMTYTKLAPTLKEYHALWKHVWLRDGMVSGLNETTAHPGAIRAYKEMGIWDKRLEYPKYIAPWE